MRGACGHCKHPIGGVHRREAGREQSNVLRLEKKKDLEKETSSESACVCEQSVNFVLFLLVFYRMYLKKKKQANPTQGSH